MNSATHVLDRFRLDGKTALITGGARGLGVTMATALAQVGADVVLAGRSTSSRRDTTTAGRSRRSQVRPALKYQLEEWMTRSCTTRPPSHPRGSPSIPAIAIPDGRTRAFLWVVYVERHCADSISRTDAWSVRKRCSIVRPSSRHRAGAGRLHLRRAAGSHRRAEPRRR